MAHPFLEVVNGFIERHVLKRAHNINDLRRYASWIVPGPMFHYMDGAAEDEVTLRRNVDDFSRYELVPNFLRDVGQIDTTTTVMGQPVSMPIVGAPTGMSALFHHGGEQAVARATERADTIYSLSTMGTATIEEIAEVCQGPKWFQIYVLRDRSLTQEFIERCKAASYQALMLTVDVPTGGNRERDLRTGLSIPPDLTLRSWLDFSLHPLWGLNYLTSREFNLRNVAHRVPIDDQSLESVVSYINKQFDPTVTWDDAAWMIEQWQGPFAIKGILSADDARRAVDIGASGIIVSNHGGRQLDHSPSPIAVLEEIVAAVDGKAEVILDGGVRRGTDVVKALALGAQACMVGRAYLFGLGAAGEAGVDRTYTILRNELVRSMTLIGASDIASIEASHVRTSSAYRR